MFFAGINSLAYSQVTGATDTLKNDTVKVTKHAENLSGQYDVGDLFHKILHPKAKPDSVKKKPSGITIIPNIASNPTIGSQIGIKAVAGRVLGNEPGTFLSVAATSASITTKGIIYFYVNHNIFTPGNKYNFQGSLVVAKTVSPDYGMGIGNGNYDSPENEILTNPARKGRALNSLYFNLREKVYKEIQKGLFVGAGASFDVRRNIEERNTTATDLTPYRIYNDRYGFDDGGYSANGLLFNVQYTTRDNQNRAYKGIYADAGFRLNQTWLGSSRGALQFTTDVRKYISLSTSHPEHVIAFWNWGSYLLSGAVPYLELAGTGRDGSFRSGRGYVNQYFKGTKYNYSEVEYRFPILKNKFISGVTFFNLQTANDDLGTKLFEKWQPGYGGGLRVLFNKATRTNLCLDYAWGKYGARGFFLGLNEAF
ncbi:BamA/TamA family outer membrane protein [Mucilaginibacter rigui]|uniref:BamA/TamA family outer membrane protein n=2 Tax=Mucilaginibacter rigui TaxID=534635 RepID=A0ABR7X2W1_9SPHI|nr:BamA/TamA family outer membrane protein [Mucilaginibacter rigui]